MLKDYAYTGKKGGYWVKFDATQDRRVKASASGPIALVPGGGGPVGDVASAVADTAEEADRLLRAKLEKIGA